MVRECEVVRRACECGAKAECAWVRKAECACAQMDRVQIARRTFRPPGPAMRDPPRAGESSRALLGLARCLGGSIEVEGQAGRAEATWRWHGVRTGAMVAGHTHMCCKQPVINRRASAMHTASKRLSATRPGCPSVLSLVANVAFYVHGTEVISTEYSTFIGYTLYLPRSVCIH